jgi:hypothetical protein
MLSQRREPTSRRSTPAGAPQPRQDRADFGIHARHGAAERGVQSAFANGETEQLRHQAAEAPIADGVGETQIDRQSHDVETERRARL